MGLLEDLRVALASRRRSSRPSERFSGISELGEAVLHGQRADGLMAMAIHGDPWGGHGLEMRALHGPLGQLFGRNDGHD